MADHRALFERTCSCGVTFTVTAKHPNQRACGRTCAGFRLVLKESALKAEARRRQARFRVAVAALSTTNRVTSGALVDLCARVYKQGWAAGYRQRWKDGLHVDVAL
jgi:hypothetical protein